MGEPGAASPCPDYTGRTRTIAQCYWGITCPLGKNILGPKRACRDGVHRPPFDTELPAGATFPANHTGGSRLPF